MYFKLIGSIFIIAAGTALGFSIAAKYTERPRQIRQLITCLASLKAYISYAAVPLPEALVSCTLGTQGVVAEFFQKTAELLTQCGWLTPKEAMDKAAKEISGLALDNTEIELLTVLGANLGYIDKFEQEKYLTMIQEQLQQLEYEASELSAKNSKMYRYLGICGGLSLVIILV